MNLEQIVEKARIQCSFLDNKQCVRITVAAAPEENISAIDTVLKNWAEKDHGKRKIITSGSLGYYDLEPVVIIDKPGHSSVLYAHATEDVVSQLIWDCVEGDNPRPDLALCTLGREDIEGVPASSVLPMLRLQKRIALRNCGLVDPEDINHYVAGCGGYAGLSRALGMGRLDVIEEMSRSRMRGRGDSGYLIAEKWKVAQEDQRKEKYVICNAVDTDVRAQTARLLLLGDPHSVLEGMLIAAYTVGASRCIVVVAAGNDGIPKKLQKALMQMRDYGLLGENIFDSGFNCDVEIREVAPSLILGEETALLRSLEGRQAMPYLENRCGAPLLGGKPALINNVETLANVSAILQRGAEWFSNIGTAASAGSKVIGLSGAAVHRYTVEVPFGTALGDIIYEIGGGIPDGGPVKAVQFGGPTGIYFSPGDLSLTVDYDGLRTAGSVMGSGTIDVVPDAVCAVEMTDSVMSYIQTQSCGKCVFCREGTLQVSDILKDITRGEGKAQDLDLLVELCEAMKVSSICDLGRNAANPVLSSIKLFHHEYDVHIKEKKCPQKP